ncbi:hypothetical protein CB1_001875001 [Camelus ferus]|nr:hypothetical protein CB1_001875001 [Camelus ferus]
MLRQEAVREAGEALRLIDSRGRTIAGTPQEKSPSGSFHFDYEVPLGRSGLKKSMVWDLPSVLAGPGSGRSAILCSSGGGPNGIFASPRRWLQQRKFQSPPDSHHGQPYVVWKSEVGSGATCPPGSVLDAWAVL